MRTFIAVPVEPARELEQILRRLDLVGRSIKPVFSDQMHITLKFLGEIDDAAVVDISSVMDAVCSQLTATSIVLQGMGVFPNRRRPTVLWAGIMDAAPLVSLETELSSQLETLGYLREQRAYHPHLTLARVKALPPQEYFDLLDEYAGESANAGCVWGTCPVDRVVLYQSQLSHGGAKYVPLATTSLKGS